MTAPKTVLITGATRGIGKGVASAFADAGWIVYGTGRASTTLSDPSVSAWASEKKITLKQADVADQAAMAAIMYEIKEKHGRLDCLINNAGVASNTPASSLGDEEISKIIDVPIGTVRSRLFRARNMLKEKLKTYARKMGYKDYRSKEDNEEE